MWFMKHNNVVGYRLKASINYYFFYYTKIFYIVSVSGVKVIG